MKKLITIIITASLAFTIQAQDVTNTLGTNGHFYIKDNSTNQLMKVDGSANMYIGEGILGYADHRTLNILETSGSAGITLSSYKNNSWSARSRVSFYSNGGTVGALTPAVTGNDIGWLDFYGWDGDAWQDGASIHTTVDGTVSDGHVPMKIDFSTDGGSGLSSRMTINSDGTVNIAGLAGGSDDDYVTVDVNGNLKRSATAPAKAPLKNEIQQLKEENAAMKAEMAELRKMVEGLMQEK